MVLPESTIEERDFDSSYDDDFVLRTKPMSMNESGFESGNTISFDEDKKAGGLTGMARLIQLNKKPIVNGIHFKILQKKVTITLPHKKVRLNFRMICFEDQDWIVSTHVAPYGFRRKP